MRTLLHANKGLYSHPVFEQSVYIPGLIFGSSDLFRYKELFAMADMSHARFLNRRQFADLTKLLKLDANPTVMEDMFVEMDSNRDGQIDFEEFMAAMVHNLSQDQLLACSDARIGPHGTTSRRRDCHFAGTPFRTKGRGGCSRMVVSPPPRVESYAATVCYPVFCHPDEFDATVLSSLHDRWQQHDCLHDRWRNHVSMMAKAPLSLAGVSIRVKRGCYHQNDCLMLSRSPHRRRSSGRLRRATTSSCGKRCRTWTATRGLESWPLQPSARLSFNCTPPLSS